MATIEQLSIEINASAQKANSAVTTLTTKLNALSTSLSKIENTNISNLTGGLERLSNSMAKLSTIKMPDYTRVAKGIQKLSQINPAQLQSASNALKSFSNSLGTLQGLQGSSQQISDLAKGISKLGYGSTITAINNMPRMADALNKMMTTLSKAPKVSKNLIDMTNALANLSLQGSKVGSASNSIMNSFNRMSNSMNKTKTSTLSLAAAFGKFYATYWVVIRGIKKLWSSVESSMNYIETLNYFNASFEQVAGKANLSSWEQLGYDSAQAYYESFSKRAEQLTQKMTGFQVTEDGMLENTRMKSLGIDPNQLMQYQATFAQMSSSMGVASETSLKLSNALTMIGADLASVKNLDFKAVWNDMASGLAGMSRTLDKYGVNIRNANLQQKLNELGIKANINALNQNDKALLRTIILLDNTKYAWADMSDTIEQPANQLRLLKSNLSNLGRTIGNILLPMVAKVLPYLNALVIALQRLAEQLVKLLGFEDFDWGGIGSSDFDISALYDEADALDNVAESAKKASDNLQGFDKINKLSDNSTNKNASGLGATSPLTNAFYDALSDYEKEWNSAFDRMENKTQTIANKIEKNFKNVFNRIKKGDFKGLGSDLSTSLNNGLKSINWQVIYKGFSNFGSGLAQFLNGLITPELFGNVGKTIASTLNTAILTSLNFAEDFDFENFGTSLATGINDFFKTFEFEKLAESLNKWVDGLKEAITSFVEELSWKDIISGIDDFLGTLELDTVAVLIGAFTIKNGLANIGKLFGVALAGKLAKKAISLKSILVGIKSITLAGNLANPFSMAASELALQFGDEIGKFFESTPEPAKKILDGIGRGIGGAVLGAVAGSWFPGGMVAGAIIGSIVASVTTIKINGKTPLQAIADGIFNMNQTLSLLDGAKFFFDEAKKAFKERKWGNIGKNILKGILFGITGAFSAITEPIQDMFSAIHEKICEVFGIHSPARKMHGIGKNILLGIMEGFTNSFDKITEPINDFFTNHIKPAFSKKKWIENMGSIKNAFKEKWDSFTTWWNGTAIVGWWNNNVTSWFSEKNWTFSGIKDGLKKAFESAISAVKGVWNGFAKFINSALNLEFKGFEKTFKIMGKKVEIGLPAFEVSLGKLPTFQTGGFPEDGLFFANHNELVGQFNNGKTAVANNEQITQGIANAVYPAVYSAVVAGMQQGGGANVNITLEGDAQGLFNVVQQQSDRYFSQTGRLPFPV